MRTFRKRQRLAEFDYGAGYAYFVTLCTHRRQALFGEIREGALQPSAAGRLLTRLWEEMPAAYPGVILDVFAVMPDHFHAVLGLITPQIALTAQPAYGVRGVIASSSEAGPAPGPAPTESLIPRVPVVPTAGLALPEVMQRFKSLTTHEYGTLVQQGQSPPYRGHLWQRGYYERVLRSDADLAAHREYVYHNAFVATVEHIP